MANLKNYLNEMVSSRVRHLPVKDKRIAKKFTDTSFWILTKRKGKKLDPFEDVFEANFEDLVLQIQGGLNLSEILGIYATEEDAKEALEKYKEIFGQK